MSAPTWHPTPNYLFVSIPQRFEAPKGPRSPEGLALTLLHGDDAMAELDAVLRQGGNNVHFEEKHERSIENIVRVGQVLQIPPFLDNTMTLSGGGPKGLRTMADITPVVEVGDTVYLDHAFLIDENEIYPGVYRVPYSAVICKIDDHIHKDSGMYDIEVGGEKRYCFISDMQAVRMYRHGIPPVPPTIVPVGGFVLLSRVWGEDVVSEDIDGRMVKCTKFPNGMIASTNVPPLTGEGVVAWVGTPLKGSLAELQAGQRVVISPMHATAETISGTEYLCVRHDYVLAVKEEDPIALLRDYLKTADPAELKSDWQNVKDMGLEGPTFSEVLAMQQILPDSSPII